MARLLIGFGIFTVLYQGSFSNNYDNHTLMRLFPTNTKQLEAASSFHDPENKVEILKSSRGINDTLDVLVPFDRMHYVEDFAKEKGLLAEVKTNYGRSFEDLNERMPRRRVLRKFNVFQYNSFHMIQEYLDTMAQRYPNLVTLETLGNSYEGRRMQLVKISTNPSIGNPVIFVDAGVHSREWVAPSMAIYLIHRLVSDPTTKLPGHELDGLDWYILPVVNPDGYEYSRASKSNRMWRKTRSKNGKCYGVDGNRNYGFKWAVSGVSHDPCHKETYAGPNAFSEPETRIVKHIMIDNAKRIKLYVSLHAYGQYLVYPWGYTGQYLPPEWKKLDRLAKAVSEKVQRAGGKPFKVLSAGKWYAAAGGSDDFAFGAAGIPYSYTMELTDGFEFSFPESLLQRTLPQFYEGFREFGTQIKNEFGRHRKKRSYDD
ncbi:unnamed protein product [Arctia plantaginis]|uniref:Peptidase M14 domain-containing protein n=1 Tax=Arctia plantaginis TaxID=874455 RepID=A0A8S0Z7P9_ARCPL|nr:unnamed protein product [Arctia plantaginis]